MQLDSNGMPKPYLTKVELLDAWEDVLNAVRQCRTIEDAHLLVTMAPSRGGRWRKASPLSHAELMRAAESLQGAPGSTTGDD